MKKINGNILPMDTGTKLCFLPFLLLAISESSPFPTTRVPQACILNPVAGGPGFKCVIPIITSNNSLKCLLNLRIKIKRKQDELKGSLRKGFPLFAMFIVVLWKLTKAWSLEFDLFHVRRAGMACC